jgi:hypothetical protein
VDQDQLNQGGNFIPLLDKEGLGVVDVECDKVELGAVKK